MNKLLSLALGLAIGALLGAALVLLFAPVSGEKLVKSLKAGYEDTLEEARTAAENRRRELEAELKMRRTNGTSSSAIERAR